MKELGHSLVFFLTYYPEMERIYVQGTPILGVETSEARQIGDHADLEAHRLLSACIDLCIRNLESSKVVRIDGRTRTSRIKRDWALEVNLWRPGQRRGISVQRQMGIYISEDAELIPWLWSRGGLAVEERIKKLLREHGHKQTAFGSKTLKNWDGGGGVALAKIPLLQGRIRSGDLTVAIEPILAKARKTLAVLTPDFMRKFLEER